MMFNANTWYRHDRKLFSIRLLPCCPFSTRVYAFFSQLLMLRFSSTVCAAGHCSTAISNYPRPAFHFALVGKRGLILFTPRASGQQTPATPLPVFSGCWYVKHHKYATIYIYIYIYMRVCVCVWDYMNR